MSIREDNLIDFYKDFFQDECPDSVETFKQDFEDSATNTDSYKLDVSQLESYDSIGHVEDGLIEHPEKVLRNAEFALAELINESAENLIVRPSNPPEKYKTNIRNIRTDNINQLLFIEGRIAKSTDVQPKIDVAAFECPSCGVFVERVISDEKIDNKPQVVECPNSDQEGHSESTKEMSDLSMIESKMEDYQRMRVQEKPEDMMGDNPKSIDATVVGDELAGIAMAGQAVTVSGILRVKQKDTDLAVLQRHIEGLNVELEDASTDDIDVTEEDEEHIHTLSEQDSIYDDLAQSIAPEIHGHEMERLGAAFLLFSGVRKEYKESEPTRGDIHVLYVGDPGTGKSRILQDVADLSPSSGVFTSGKGASSAGITAAAVKDKEFGGDDKWTLKAGALVMADNGIACVDELDKMRDNDRAALHEGLEQQKVSISKAGINATLNSRCSLLAAANPKHGRFTEHEQVTEQIDLQPALISRFDLIFVIKDKADSDVDEKVAETVLENSRKGERNVQKKQSYMAEKGLDDWDEAPTDSEETELEGVDSPISKEMFRKYLAYSKQEYHPQLSDEAFNKIQQFYIRIREEGEENDVTSITARALQDLVRLTEAAARIKLSNTATSEHAQKAIDLYLYHMKEVGVDPDTGEFDAGALDSSTTGSQRDRIVQVKQVINDLDEEGDGHADKDEVIETLSENHSETKIEGTIRKLLMQGELIEPSVGELRVV